MNFYSIIPGFLLLYFAFVESTGELRRSVPVEYSGDFMLYSDDSDELSGSGMEESVTDCQKLYIRNREKQRDGKRVDYVPRCTALGEYEAIQCDLEDNDCFCVTFNGKEIPETRRASPARPNCRNIDRSGIHTFEPPIIKQSNENVGKSKGESSEDISIDDNSTGDDSGDVGIFKEETQLQRSFLSQPLILAAIIAMAVVCLLCAVLLVMFIVYRMRKKDEGSYALDEPKPSHLYQRAPTKEYYA